MVLILLQLKMTRYDSSTTLFHERRMSILQEIVNTKTFTDPNDDFLGFRVLWFFLIIFISILLAWIIPECIQYFMVEIVKFQVIFDREEALPHLVRYLQSKKEREEIVDSLKVVSGSPTLPQPTNRCSFAPEIVPECRSSSNSLFGGEGDDHHWKGYSNGPMGYLKTNGMILIYLFIRVTIILVALYVSFLVLDMDMAALVGSFGLATLVALMFGFGNFWSFLWIITTAKISPGDIVEFNEDSSLHIGCILKIGVGHVEMISLSHHRWLDLDHSKLPEGYGRDGVHAHYWKKKTTQVPNVLFTTKIIRVLEMQ